MKFLHSMMDFHGTTRMTITSEPLNQEPDITRE